MIAALEGAARGLAFVAVVAALIACAAIMGSFAFATIYLFENLQAPACDAGAASLEGTDT